MPYQRETILLNAQDYNAAARTWNIPILRLENVDLCDLFINNKKVDDAQWRAKNNLVSLSDQVQVEANATAYAVVCIKPESFMKTWGPVIVAALGFLGAIAQPILHRMGLIYQPEPTRITAQAASWGYDTETRRFSLDAVLDDVRSGDAEKWDLYLLVREVDASVDRSHAKYSVIAGPFAPSKKVEIEAQCDKQFDDGVRQSTAFVQGVLVLVRKGYAVKPPFVPADHSAESVRILCSPGHRPYTATTRPEN